VSTSRWAELERVFHAAWKLGAGQRREFVARELAHEPDLIGEVETLLAAAELDTHFLETSLVDGATAPAETPTIGPGRMVGPYRVIRELGRGGMGVVYEAEQNMPRRRVALKVIQGGPTGEGGAHPLARESRILGRLTHPGIAAIYDANQTTDGWPYFVMELIAGQRLDAVADERRLSRRDRLRLFGKVCDALQYAHARSVIHLDLKPSNILVSGAPDARVDELQVKVVDFGVAAVTGSDTTGPTVVGQTGGLPGTLAYMSPEQRRGQRDAIDVRSDVYALGVILFKLMTGALPYPVEGLPYPDAWRMLAEDRPRRPRELIPSLPLDVDTIIRTATAEELTRRYQSVADLAGDVRRYLADLPIAARPPSKTYEWAKFAQRNKGLVATLAALLLGLTATIVGTSLGLVRAREMEAEARAQAAMAQTLLDMLATEFQSRGEPTPERVESSAEGPQPEPLVIRRSALDAKRAAAQREIADGRLAEAAADYDRLVRIARALFPEANWYVASLAAEYGECLLQLRRFESAEPVLTMSYQDFRVALGSDHPRTRDAAKRLARLYIISGQPDKAEFWTALLSSTTRPAP
jgi:serine/threonine protein kinase